jgi:hypothetical protein
VTLTAEGMATQRAVDDESMSPCGQVRSAHPDVWRVGGEEDSCRPSARPWAKSHLVSPHGEQRNEPARGNKMQGQIGGFEWQATGMGRDILAV